MQRGPAALFGDIMQHIQIHGAAGDSDILIGCPLQDLQFRLPTEKVMILTDHTVAGLLSHLFPKGPIISAPQGETSKTLESAASIFREMVAAQADRSTMLIGIGGGIVCDLTGFVASTYMRGLRFAFAPTTLLAQVDASVGGKNGVNLDGYKNMIGVFNQPELVLCDLEVLSSLPAREIGCGLAEIVKHAAIADRELFDFLEANADGLLNLDPAALERVISDSVRIKSGVVNADEKETGERRKLNFGHTLGHAVEKMAGLPHGEAVSVGMAMAGTISIRRGLLREEEHQRLTKLLKRFRLPTSLDSLGLDPQTLLQTMRKDKKREGDSIHLVLLHGLGRAVVEPTSLDELRAALGT